MGDVITPSFKKYVLSGFVSVGVCGNVCCVAAVVKDSGFLSLGVLKYVCVRGVMNVVFYFGL